MINLALLAVDFRGPLLKLFNHFSNPNGTTSVEVVISFFAVLVILFVVFPIHECSHGLMAKLLGDDTAERSGRLTLNPFSHIAPMGALIMLIFPIGWAKPVPVDPTRCSKVKPKTAMALTAIAGPLSNIILAYIFMIVFKVVVYGIALSDGGAAFEYAIMAFQYVIFINLYLAVFNLFPIPPLDGSKILFFFLKPKWNIWLLQRQRFIALAFYLLIFIPILPGGRALVPTIIGEVSSWIYSGFISLTGFVDHLYGL